MSDYRPAMNFMSDGVNFFTPANDKMAPCEVVEMLDHYFVLKEENERLKEDLEVVRNHYELAALGRESMEIDLIAEKERSQRFKEALVIAARGETQFDGVEAMHAARHALASSEQEKG